MFSPPPPTVPLREGHRRPPIRRSRLRRAAGPATDRAPTGSATVEADLRARRRRPGQLSMYRRLMPEPLAETTRSLAAVDGPAGRRTTITSANGAALYRRHHGANIFKF